MPQELTWSLKHLREFSINNNKIKHLPQFFLKESPKLREFDASNNLIEEIPFGFFSYNPYLSTLNLQNNQITRIQVNFYQFTWRHLDLRNNTCIQKSRGSKDDPENEKHIENVIKQVKISCK